MTCAYASFQKHTASTVVKRSGSTMQVVSIVHFKLNTCLIPFDKLANNVNN